MALECRRARTTRVAKHVRAKLMWFSEKSQFPLLYSTVLNNNSRSIFNLNVIETNSYYVK